MKRFNSIIGNPEQGLALINESIASLRPLNRPAAMISVLLDEATNNTFLNNFVQVSKSAQEFGQLAHELGDRWMEGFSLGFQSLSLLAQGRLAETGLQIFAAEIGKYMGLTWAALVMDNAVMGGHADVTFGFHL